jgi:1-acyl-sn-glycerol-3-phosphate acyltransferase
MPPQPRTPSQSPPADVLASNSPLMNGARTVLYWVLWAWLRLRNDLQVERGEVLRQAGNFVLIANHASHVDTVALLAVLPPSLRNRCFSAAAEDYFYTNWFRRLSARLFANTFPFRRQGPDARMGLEASARILTRGDSLIIYPEGTRTTTGRLQRFRKGIGLLVQGMPYAVIPVAITGTHRVMGKGSWFPRRGHIRVRVGTPETFAHAGRDDASAAAIANHLQERVRVLLGQPAVAETGGDDEQRDA